MSNDSSDNDRQRHPIIKREVSLGDIVSLLVALASIMVAYGKLDTRITVVEVTQSAQVKTNDTFQNDLKDTMKSITEKISSIADRMPRK